MRSRGNREENWSYKSQNAIDLQQYKAAFKIDAASICGNRFMKCLHICVSHRMVIVNSIFVLSITSLVENIPSIIIRGIRFAMYWRKTITTLTLYLYLQLPIWYGCFAFEDWIISNVCALLGLFWMPHSMVLLTSFKITSRHLEAIDCLEFSCLCGAPNWVSRWVDGTLTSEVAPESKVYGANMGPTWGRQDPGGSHVVPVKLAIWGTPSHSHTPPCSPKDYECSSHILLVQCQYIRSLMRFDYFKTWPWKSEAKLMACDQSQAHTVGSVTNRFTPVSFDINRPHHCWDTYSFSNTRPRKSKVKAMAKIKTDGHI